METWESLLRYSEVVDACDGGLGSSQESPNNLLGSPIDNESMFNAGSSFGNSNTGIKIRSREPKHSTVAIFDQGSTTRRIRLQHNRVKVVANHVNW